MTGNAQITDQQIIDVMDNDQGVNGAEARVRVYRDLLSAYNNNIDAVIARCKPIIRNILFGVELAVDYDNDQIDAFVYRVCDGLQDELKIIQQTAVDITDAALADMLLKREQENLDIENLLSGTADVAFMLLFAEQFGNDINAIKNRCHNVVKRLCLVDTDLYLVSAEESLVLTGLLCDHLIAQFNITIENNALGKTLEEICQLLEQLIADHILQNENIPMMFSKPATQQAHSQSTQLAHWQAWQSTLIFSPMGSQVEQMDGLAYGNNSPAGP